MTAIRLTKLTTRQRECLRLYHRRYRIKEIARALDISENTASGYLTSAAALLDIGGRQAAAAALIAFEQDHPEARGRFSIDVTNKATIEPFVRAYEETDPMVGHPSSTTSTDVQTGCAQTCSHDIADDAWRENGEIEGYGADHRYSVGRFGVDDRGISPSAEAGHRRNPAVPPTSVPASRRHGGAWIPFRQRYGNDLTIARRFIWLGVATFLLVSGFGIFAFFIRTISELARGSSL